MAKPLDLPLVTSAFLFLKPLKMSGFLCFIIVFRIYHALISARVRLVEFAAALGRKVI